MNTRRPLNGSIACLFFTAALVCMLVPAGAFAGNPLTAPALTIVPVQDNALNAKTVGATAAAVTKCELTSSQGITVKVMGSAEPGITYTYTWYKNNVLQPDLTTALVPKEKTKKGEVWKCEVTPTDGKDTGPAATIEAVIVNSPPQFISKQHIVVVAGNHPAPVSLKAEDADGDYLNYTDPALPAGAVMDPENRVITFTPQGKEGSYTLQFKVSDADAETAQTLTVTTVPGMLGTDLSSSFVPPVRSQGQMGSCASWATAYYYKTFQEGKEHNWDVTDLKHICSPAFIYNQQVKGNKNSGTSFSGNFRLVLAQGCASWNTMPYIDGDCSTFPNQAQFEDGMPFRADSYAGLTVTDITALRSQLDSGDIFVMAVPVYADYLGPTGTNDVHDGPRGSSAYQGGHGITIVGYDDNRQYTNASGQICYGAFKFVNSWGSTWSDDGYSWLSYTFVTNYAWEAWKMTDRIGYYAKGIAVFHITHPNRNDLIVKVGVGNTATPPWSYTPFVNNAAAGIKDVDAAIDITDALTYLPPSTNNKWFVGAADSVAGNSGTVDAFKVKYRTSADGVFQEFNATDVPVAIPDGTSVYAYSYVSGGAVVPVAPSNLQASGISSSEIKINWTDNSNNEDGFKIERKTGAGGTYAVIASAGANVTTYTDSGLTLGNTYYYRVLAYNATGNSSYSNEANAAPLNIPAAPTNLVATAASTTQINLTWTDNSTNETGFNLEQSTDGTTFTKIISLAANTVSYSVKSLNPGTRYYFRVNAYNASAVSPYSNIAQVSTMALPGAPSNLTATVLSSTQIKLTWTDNSVDETGFRIERKVGAAGTWTALVTLGANVTTYTNSGLTAQTDYFYRVTAVRGSDYSACSSEIQAITMALPVAPSNLTATATGDSKITLAWTDNSADETGFRIERKTGETGTWASIASVAANVTTYANSGLTEETNYYYRVRAVRGSDYSVYSNEAQTTTMAKPHEPSNLTATAPLATRITLTWTDNSDDETGFRIERKTGETGTWTSVASVAANITTYTNSGLTAETGYYYRVRAVRGSDYSLYSNEAQATTMTLPSAPSNLTASVLSSAQLKLTWTDNSADETGFRIERKTGSAGTWASVASVAANVTTYTNSGLTAGTDYYYRVRAIRVVDYSLYSNEAQATTMALPAAPSNLTAATVSSAQLKLTWTDNSADETGFRIERKTGSAGTWAYVASVAANVTSYTNSGLTAVTGYYYRVRTIRVADYSLYSNETQATTMPLPSAPSNLTAAALSKSQIKLAWTDKSGDETGFRIERMAGTTGTWSAIATVGANVTTYTNSGLVTQNPYSYRVRAVRASDYSLYSNSAVVKTP